MIVRKSAEPKHVTELVLKEKKFVLFESERNILRKSRIDRRKKNNFVFGLPVRIHIKRFVLRFDRSMIVCNFYSLFLVLIFGFFYLETNVKSR